MSRLRRNHSPTFEAKVATAGSQGQQTLGDRAEEEMVPAARLNHGPNNTMLSSRRRFLLLAAMTPLATTRASDSTQSLSETLPMSAPAFELQHTPVPLPFAANSLQGLSEKLVQSHWENNYGGSVKTLNAVKQRLALADKDMPPFVYNGLKREHLMRTGSVVYHEAYFANLGGNGRADATLRTRIGAAFGSFDAWETEFRRIGAGLGGGSGWVALGCNLHTAQLENYWLSDHLHGPAGTLPLLVMDMYEHSYQMDYGAAAAKYIDAFFQNIQWEVVGLRLARAERANQGRVS
jgi:Fe-Mn family superoxide dismutase